ncbi:PilZ domain-containing protein [Novosphingobium pentaromativorans]|nr:PilZ domain-containing protein [Novosphingobium pentaromativorans]
MQESHRASRQAERLSIMVPAVCRLRNGFRDHVMVYDISIGGCRIKSCAVNLRVGDIVVVRPEMLEGLGGEVRWVNGREAGIRFVQPLYAPVVEHLHRNHRTFLTSVRNSASPPLRMIA